MSASGGNVTFVLTDDCAGLFAIDPATGEITAADGDLINPVVVPRV